MQITVSAHAKLNLTLDIIGRRGDGYHLLEMILQSVDLADTVTVTQDDGPDVRLLCSLPALAGEENLAFRAAVVYLRQAGLPEAGLRIKIKKRIPLSAGLAGGSADAAAVLCALDRMYGRLDRHALAALALSLGVDVPFCMAGGTILAQATGGLLTPLPDLPDCVFVLVKPGDKPSTGDMYRRYDALEAVRRPETARAAEAICAGDLETLAACAANVFDSLWDNEPTRIARGILSAHDALGVSLSGSGPTVFGIFRQAAAADRCAAALRAQFDEVFVCRPCGAGCELAVSGA